jgi:hypothetical protein
LFAYRTRKFIGTNLNLFEIAKWWDKPDVGLKDIAANSALDPTNDAYWLRKKEEEWWKGSIKGISCR